jgi:hypothetical protein
MFTAQIDSLDFPCFYGSDDSGLVTGPIGLTVSPGPYYDYAGARSAATGAVVAANLQLDRLA